MKRLTIRSTLPVFVALTALSLSLGGDSDKPMSWNAKSALKEMDKALKGVRGLTAMLHWDELVCDQQIRGSGKFYVNLSGLVRADVGGSNPRTIIVTPPFFYIYNKLEGAAHRFYLPSRPDVLGQYALAGFNPAGSDLKKQYKVEFLRSEELDGHDTVVFNLVPKSKEAAAAIAAIVLWVDQETWMPFQQIIRHASSGLQGTLRYTDIAPANDMSDDVFKKAWPADTKIVPQ